MTRAYGGCIEPEGMELDERHDTVPCPRCEAPARSWFCERAESGSINTYSGLRCTACDYQEGDDPNDWEP